MTFGQKIKALRELKGLKQTEAAKLLNMSAKKLSYYELDQRQMDYDTLISVAKFYDVTIDYLLGVENAIITKAIDKGYTAEHLNKLIEALPNLKEI